MCCDPENDEDGSSKAMHILAARASRSISACQGCAWLLSTRTSGAANKSKSKEQPLSQAEDDDVLIRPEVSRVASSSKVSPKH